MKLTISSGENAGKSLEVDDRLVIGRESGSDVVLDKDDEVSREHAYLEPKDGEVEIGDMGSRNGTFVNGQRIKKPRRLASGDKIRIGRTEFEFEGAEDPGRTVLAATPETKGRAEAPPPKQPPSKPPTPRAEPTPPQFERSGSSGVREALTRRSRVATAIAIGAGVVAVAAVVVAVTGVFSSSKPSTEDIVASAKPSTVLVLANQGGQPQVSGSGWAYDADKGLIVTNSHVVAPGQTFQVGVDGQLRDATVLGVSPCDDLAVLQVSDHSGLKTLPLSSGSDVNQGDSVVALGYPAGAAAQDALVSTAGTVSVASTSTGDFNASNLAPIPNVIQTDTAINPGNSGGPLVGDDKKLIGVNESASLFDQNGTPLQNENFAVSVDRVKAVVPQLAAGNSIGYLGFGFEVEPTGGLKIVGAPDSTKSGQAGANDAVGAVVASIDGQAVPFFSDYCKVVRSLQPGDPVTLQATNGATARVIVE